MSNYLVTDTELTSIANAIRTKGGTSESLSFPTEFVSAIGNISGGGGGDSDFTTAKVTVTVVNVGEETIPSADSEFAMYGFPTVQVDKCYGYVSFTSPVTDIPTNGTYGYEYDVILYKGYCITPSAYEWSSIHLEISEAPTVTGGVSIDGNAALTITGDGTITIPVVYYS